MPRVIASARTAGRNPSEKLSPATAGTLPDRFSGNTAYRQVHELRHVPAPAMRNAAVSDAATLRPPARVSTAQR